MQAAARVRVLSPSFRGVRMTSSPSLPKAKKKPSPYRIPKLETFSADFAPLANAGWQIASTAPASAHLPPPEGEGVRIEDALQLEHKRLVRSYHSNDYGQLLEVLGRIGRVVEEQQHHPTLVTGPACDVSDTKEGYVLRVSMLTHTPMPPLGTQVERKLAPGVTGKDLKLAAAIEELWSGSGTKGSES